MVKCRFFVEKNRSETYIWLIYDKLYIRSGHKMSENEEYSNPDDFTNSQLFQLLGLNYDSDGEDENGNMFYPVSFVFSNAQVRELSDANS